VGLSTLHVRFDALDLSLQRGNALGQLLDRQWIEILPGELDQRIAGFAREEVFQIHRAGIVDP